MISAESVEKLKEMIGKESEPYEIEIEKGTIWRLAEAIGDPNPLWQNEDKAKRSRYGGVIAPPALCMSLMMNPLNQGKFSMPAIKGSRGFDAEHNWKFYAPARPGDVIKVTSKVVDVYERQGKKSGNMVFYVIETTLTNQRGEIICEERGSNVMM